MNNLLPIAAACLLVGGGIGYVVGNNGPDSSEASEVDGSRSGSSGSSRSISRGSSGGGEKPKDSRFTTYADVVAEPGQTARLQALIDLYSGLSGDEFINEAERLNDMPMEERILASFLLFSAWAEVSPYDAFDHVETMGFVGNFVRPTVLQSWAASDPQAAAQYFETNKGQFAMMGMMGGRRGGSSGAGMIASEWAKQDPEGALKWASALEGRDKSGATSKILSQIASTDPARAAEMAGGMDSEALGSANRSIAREWAKKDWGATESWIAGLPADQQDSALSSAVRSLANENPSLAKTKALEIPEGDARNDAVEDVAKAMARQSNPEEAVSWVMENGTEEAQRGAMREVMGSWVSDDPAAAKDWVQKQPEGEVRDSAVSSYIMNDHNGNPEEQIQMAESISSDGSRGWSVGVAAVRWMEKDPTAATEYIDNTEFLDERGKRMVKARAGGDGR